jgi:hypothetical protein
MHVLTERRYIFKRRSGKLRITLAVIASAVAVAALTAQVAHAKPGGYQRAINMEEPAK